jgi:hypothetical protein
MTKLVAGMLHLPPLPGAPLGSASIDRIEEKVLREASVLFETGFAAAVLENFGDVPFFKDRVDESTIASMTRIAAAVRREVPALRLGINVLRNDALAALAIAAATGASFIRVNVHVGVTATDQGVVEGRAAETLRRRKALGADVEIWSDVHVKHGKNLGHDRIEAEADDAVARGLADALIVSGSATGAAAALSDVEAALGHGAPVYIGSGIDTDNVSDYLAIADGVIVGTWIKEDGKTTAPIDRDRCLRLIERVYGSSGKPSTT